MIIWLARLGNIAMLLFFGSIISYEIYRGRLDVQPMGWIAGSLVLIVPIISLYCLASSESNSKINNIWPFIMFKRMAMEERKKIEKLEQQTK